MSTYTELVPYDDQLKNQLDIECWHLLINQLFEQLNGEFRGDRRWQLRAHLMGQL